MTASSASLSIHDILLIYPRDLISLIELNLTKLGTAVNTAKGERFKIVDELQRRLGSEIVVI